MRPPLFASPVERHRFPAALILCLSCLIQPLQAEPLAKLAPGYVERPAYTPVSATRRTSAPAYPASYAPITPSAALESKVTKLAKNDQRQDLRLRDLEKDVDYLGKITGSAAHRPAGAPYKPPAPPAPTKFYTVRPGDNLWRIASKHHVSINDIRTANRMSNDTVMLGQTLVIPGSGAGQLAPGSAPAPVGLYVVKAGDTFSQVAAAHRVSQVALARANPTVVPARLMIGARVVIPGKSAAPAADLPPPAQAARTESTSPLLTHTVRAGESLGVIAKSFGVPTASVAAANKLKNPNLLVAGQRLVIPAKESIATSLVSTAPKQAEHENLAAMPGTISRPDASFQSSPLKFGALTPAPTPPDPAKSKPASMPTGAHRGVLAYRLERGDTIETVANMFSTTSHEIRAMNNLAADAEVKEGDEVVVPAMGPVSLN